MVKVGTTFDGGVSVSLDNGDGTFQDAQDVTGDQEEGSASHPYCLTAANFDDDNRGLEASDQSSFGDPAGVSVMFVFGDGAFQAQYFMVGENASFVIDADINADSEPEPTVGPGCSYALLLLIFRYHKESWSLTAPAVSNGVGMSGALVLPLPSLE
jgi:hypothetical protein